ncbi:hypothetical protein MAP_3363c [Mycobacterium avium subsp. paratuberculosis K-10]|uniref:Uncharacterized protein n=1 Tax=Mycolicibacterium paratuberculosis (strain ATCC BAA-968 / K-10) TaxID=262316 RepID=Q73UK5_MYCPA|nr:hypothetical protein MAP_3363c [Mycobacterium avium subsp. paratuberculosis K-10]
MRIRVRRGQGLAGGRHRPGHPLGRHPGGLELPGLRRGEKRLRDGGSGAALIGLKPDAQTRYCRGCEADAVRRGVARPAARLGAGCDAGSAGDPGLVGHHAVRRGPGRRHQPSDHLQRVRLPARPGAGVRAAPSRPPGRHHPRGPGRPRRQHLRVVPGRLPQVLRRRGGRPAGDLAAHRRRQARPVAADHHRQRGHHHPRVGAAGLGADAHLGVHHRRGRRGAGPRHRAAGAELRVDAARGRPRRGRRSGPVDDAVRRAARRRQRRVSVPWPRRGADPRLQWRKNIPKLITQ